MTVHTQEKVIAKQMKMIKLFVLYLQFHLQDVWHIS